MLCALILYMSGETYSLKSTPNDRFLSNFFMAILFTLRVLARNYFKKTYLKKKKLVSYKSTKIFKENTVVRYSLLVSLWFFCTGLIKFIIFSIEFCRKKLILFENKLNENFFAT